MTIDSTIQVLAYFDECPPTDLMADTAEKHMWHGMRFNSLLGEDGTWIPYGKPMDRAYHYRDVHLADEAAIDAWVQAEMTVPLDRQHPPWRVNVLRTERGRSAVFFQINHACGDGLGLIFAMAPMFTCGPAGADPIDPVERLPLPDLWLPKHVREKKKAERKAAGKDSKGEAPEKKGLRFYTGEALFCFKGALAPLFTRHDTETGLNPPIAQRTPFVTYNGSRVYTPFPSVSMDDIKKIRGKYSCSVNDALMAAFSGALRRYGAEVHGDKKLQPGGGPVEFKSIFMIGLPRKTDPDDPVGSSANNSLFSTVHLPVGEEDREKRMDLAKNAFNDIKSMGYVAGLQVLQFLLHRSPQLLRRKIVAEAMSKHTLLMTHVPCTTEPLTVPKYVGGREVLELQLVFPFLLPFLSIMTYNQRIYSNLVADPALFPKAELLGKYYLEEIEILAAGGAAE